MSTASFDKFSKSTQTDNLNQWENPLNDLENHLDTLQKFSIDLLKAQNSLKTELKEAKKTEENILTQIKENQQQIIDLEIEISDYKKQLISLQEYFSILYQQVLYDSLMGDPIPAIFSILN
jgi:chromosome segregation ATPase